jgi:hypothetical protein
MTRQNFIEATRIPPPAVRSVGSPANVRSGHSRVSGARILQVRSGALLVACGVRVCSGAATIPGLASQFASPRWSLAALWLCLRRSVVAVAKMQPLGVFNLVPAWRSL